MKTKTQNTPQTNSDYYEMDKFSEYQQNSAELVEKGIFVYIYL